MDINKFTKTYERINPNREDMNLVQFAQLMGILGRDTKQDIESLANKFKTVNQTIIDQIKQSYTEDDEYT
ncbi:hypothetical protein K1T71_001000 [Dendrolimus kikuchii]|uniref:Uncharacterized protein n=1 Tax=Dendrolimus kikuchii TaxID=765133 RepID=A0ACC1DGY2_9NEOP|nr:hypothetical protein K1T71_001000 [Dendrolimus kikuchii]